MEKNNDSKNLKIAIVGPESSGKSTLVEELVTFYNASNYVHEFARNYLVETNGLYERKTLDYILNEQLKLEKLYPKEPVLFCDTSSIDLKVWSYYKYGLVSDLIQSKFEKADYDFILLLKPDLKFETDPLRENAPQKNRNELFEIFKRETLSSKIPFSIIEGQKNIRLKNAINALQNQFSF